jgi:hypothetical protein
LLHVVAIRTDCIENTIRSGTSIGYVAWRVPMLRYFLLCHCVAMAASSILHVTISYLYADGGSSKKKTFLTGDHFEHSGKVAS